MTQPSHPTPKRAGFHQPAEWEMHDACWLAWPSHAHLWEENLPLAQAEFSAFAEAIVDIDPTTRLPRGEKLNVLVPTAEAGAAAEQALRGLHAKIHPIPFGDIWLRDTAPIFLKNAKGESATIRFAFNGWGEKYSLPHDREVSAAIQKVAGVQSQFSVPWVLEGGSVDVDGLGTCLTTRQCLLNENRNPNMAEEAIEAGLCESLGLKKILWVGDGLINDHTDGHIDTIARFAPGGRVICMEARNAKDPNREILKQIISDLGSMTNAHGEKLEIVKAPSPGLVLDEDDDLMPASFVNFYIANTTVIVPTYGTDFDKEAVEVIASCFPGRKTIGLSAKAILSGGGAFHCISQQQL